MRRYFQPRPIFHPKSAIKGGRYKGATKYTCAVMIKRIADGEVASHFHFAGKLRVVFELRNKQNSQERRRLKMAALSEVVEIFVL